MSKYIHTYAGFAMKRSWLKTLQANINCERALARTDYPLLGPKASVIMTYSLALSTVLAYTSLVVNVEMQVATQWWAISQLSHLYIQFLITVTNSCRTEGRVKWEENSS